jgi:hypothetical protein
MGINLRADVFMACMTDETTRPTTSEEPSHVHVQRPSRRRRGGPPTWPEYILTPVSVEDTAESDEAAA